MRTAANHLRAGATAALLCVTLCWAVCLGLACGNAPQAHADDVSVDSVRAAIHSLSVDPCDYSADDLESVEAIQADFESLSAEDQAMLEDECSHPDSSQPLGRVLETALWSVWSYDEVDDTTTLPNGTYDATTTPALSSEYSKGKSTSSRQRPWSVKSVYVHDGHATATITVQSDTYPSVWKGGVSYPKTNTSGNCEFAGVPIDLNSTFYFAGVSSSMPVPIAFSLTTTIEEPEPYDEGRIDLSITNTTGMFKAESAYLVTEEGQTNLVMALSGSGYHNLYKGTYEQAVANGNNRENWIAGYQNDEGRWEFVIPVNTGETHIPCVAISQREVDRADAGGSPLERAFYPRQLELDAGAQTLITGDYDATETFGVTSKLSTFSVDPEAAVRVIGGPNSNNYSCAPTLVMRDDTYDKVRYPTVENGQVVQAEKGASAEDNSFDIVMKNAPSVAAFNDKEPVSMQFHVALTDEWVERIVTLDLLSKTITVEGEELGGIDYVKKLIEALPDDPYDVDSSHASLVNRAQAAYSALPQSDQEALDQQLPPGGNLYYGRVLECAVWALDALNAVDNSTTLADGTYSSVGSTWSLGKSDSARQRGFTIKKVTVKNGKATALIEHNSNTSDKVKVGGKEYKNLTPDGNSTFEIPIDLNSTFHFSYVRKNADVSVAIPVEMTSTIDEASAKPDSEQKPDGGSSDDGKDGGKDSGSKDNGSNSGSKPSGNSSSNGSGGKASGNTSNTGNGGSSASNSGSSGSSANKKASSRVTSSNTSGSRANITAGTKTNSKATKSATKSSNKSKTTPSLLTKKTQKEADAETLGAEAAYADTLDANADDSTSSNSILPGVLSLLALLIAAGIGAWFFAMRFRKAERW